MPRPALEVADLLRTLAQQGRLPPLCSALAKVVRALIACRTAALGGHVDLCDACGLQTISYNSCGNRHCPKCQSSATAAWLQAQREVLLPVPYAHVIFTLPDLLAPLALQNPRVLYGLLFRAVSQTLLQAGATACHLGARLGFLAILHTWGQLLQHHPHLHCVVPAGGLAPDGSRWIRCPPGYFLPVGVLSRLFRGKFLALLGQAYRAGTLQFHGQLHHLAAPSSFYALLGQARALDWVVYAKPPFGGPDAVLKYLARYTHRIAISNHRLLSGTNGRVRFTWKDYKHGARQRVSELELGEFVRRFLLHVLPTRFVKIRYYGFLANAQRYTALALCRKHLDRAPEPAPTPAALAATAAEPDALRDPALCPHCGRGRLHYLQILPRLDTS